MPLSDQYFANIIESRHLSFLCQIELTDEEYAQLLRIARFKLRTLQTYSIVPVDLTISVMLVQVAIRCYREGKYWPVFLEEIGLDLPSSKRNYLGQIFYKTISSYHLFALPQNGSGTIQYVENIKAHAFVTDWYLNGYFDFAYAYFENNLFRELTDEIGEDLEDLSAFMETTLNSDKDAITSGEGGKKAAKSYRLLRSTRAAFAYGEQTVLHDLFLPALKIIDRYYYDSVLPETAEDRFARGFHAWVREQEKSVRVREAQGSIVRRIASRRPFLRVDPTQERASLVIPAQKFRHDDCDGAASVQVEINGHAHTWELSLYRSFGIFISEMLEIPIPDVFDEIRISVSARTKKEYKIPRASYRIFNDSWESIQKPISGHNYLLAKKNVFVSSARAEDLIEFSDSYAFWKYLSVLVSDESVFFIGGRPLSLAGEFSPEPVFEHEIDSFQVREQNGRTLKAARSHPEVSFVVDKDRLRGTVLLVNQNRLPIDAIQEKTVFDWPQDKHKTAVTVPLDRILPREDGVFHVVLDVPAQENRTLCTYLLLQNFKCLFDKRKYTYDTHMLLEIQHGAHTVSVPDEKWICEWNTDGVLEYRIPIESGMSSVSFKLDERYEIVLPVKLFQYGFSHAEMRIDRPDYLWYADIGETLYVAIPGATEVQAYWGKDTKSAVSGELLEGCIFRIDISEIKRRIYAEERKHWQYINISYRDNAIRRMSLPPILRSVNIKPYFNNLRSDGNVPCLDVEEILGAADVFLNIQEQESGRPVVSGRKITVGRNQFPELSKGVSYQLLPYSQEEDEFGFSAEILNLKPIRNVSFEDWNELTGCRLAIKEIQQEEVSLQLAYDYFVTLHDRIGTDTYIGTLVGKKLSGSTGKIRYATYMSRKTIQESLGKVRVYTSIQGDELLVSLQVYSEGNWAELYYDTQNQSLLHCDHPLVRKEGQDYARFLMLDEYDTIMTVSTNHITRPRPVPQRT